MKNIILGLILLVMTNFPSTAKDKTYYCYDPEYNNFYTRDISVHENLSNRCQKEQQPKAIEITKDIYDKSQKIIGDPSFHLWIPQHQQKLVDLITNSKEEKSVKKNDQIILSNKSEFNSNVSKFSKKCEDGFFTRGFKKGTPEFNDCLKREQKLAVLEEQKLQIINEEKNKKVLQQKDLDQAKIREEQIKVSKMKPDDRYAYTCSEKFGFKRSSDKFKDCIFEMYKAETELEKLELQKQVAKANLEAARAGAEAARAGAERQERLSFAQTEAAKMQAYALEQQAIASKTANNLLLLETGLRMLSPAPAPPRTATTCSFNGRFMNCF